LPDLISASNRDGAVVHRHAHWPIEVVKRERELAVDRADVYQFSSLICGNQQRRT
jgi:hypothetical protein